MQSPDDFIHVQKVNWVISLFPTQIAMNLLIYKDRIYDKKVS